MQTITTSNHNQVTPDTDVSSSVIFKKLSPIEQFGEAIFASDECGDTMWNEENLNPPSQNQQ